MNLALAVALGVMYAAAGDATGDVPYGVDDWPEEFGNHRAVVRVDTAADAVYVRIPWRRLDAQPEAKDILVVPAGKDRPVHNRVIISVSAEYGEIAFEAKTPGDYHVYYMPYKPQHQMGFGSESYSPREDRAGAAWLAANTPKWQADPRVCPEAVVVGIEARGDWNRLDPMEVPATAAELQALLDGHANAPLLLFPEDRRYPIRMNDHLPLRWIRTGPQGTFQGEAQRGEFYALQIGVFAARQQLDDVQVVFSDLKSGDAVLPASALRCFNLGGIDWTGRAFTKRVDVPVGRIQALWCGVAVPEDARPGVYTGTVSIGAANAPAQAVNVVLTVSANVIPEHGDTDLWRHARLRWLDSTLGLDDTVVAPYTPLEVRGDTVACLGRDVTLAPSGLLSSIRSGDREILAAPMAFTVTTDAGPAAWTNATPPEFIKQTPGKVAWTARSESDAFTLDVACRMEFDGYLNLAMTLTAKRAVSLQDTQLVVPIRRDAATYMMGMGRKGGLRPEAWDWQWDRAKHQDSLWIGAVDAGLQCKLKGPDYSWPLVNIHYKRKPLDMPDAWCNGGRGGCRVREEGDTVVVTAFGGPRTLAEGEALAFDAGLLITPVKPVDYAGHWQARYYHAYEPVAKAAEAGAKIINIHHANDINPYINYPFLRIDRIAAYAREAHDAGLKMKIYYTLREISNHMTELWAVRSLGTEIFADGPGGGYAWLQEHLRTGYVPAWQHFFPDGDVDASIVTQGLSRWHNYYLEGLGYLIRHADIDGLYLDDIGFDREVMQRARKIMDAAKPGCLIDVHSWNHFNDVAGFANCANLYLEHMPYVNTLWLGEAFDYNEQPDYWLVEISGIPFGIMSEMLQDGGNPWRGMVYGMTNRLPWCGDPRPLWKLWDDFSIQDAQMRGYWDPACPVKTDRDDVLATAYVKPGATLLAVASWAAEPVQARLVIDWPALGLDPASAVLRAPEIAGMQSAGDAPVDAPLVIAPGKGWLGTVESGK